MRRVFAAALGAAASLLAVSSASAAGVVLDQDNIPETGTFAFAGGSGHQIGSLGSLQTFTVGVAGYLDHVVVAAENWTFLGAGGGVRFQVQDAAYNTLHSQDFTAAEVPDFGFSGFNWADALSMSVRSSNIAVNAGETYVLKLALLGTGSVTWRTGYSGQSITYAGGENYSYDFFPGNPNPFPLGTDFGFRTYVDTGVLAQAPEPGAWALMILGFGALGATLRQRRAAAAA